MRSRYLPLERKIDVDPIVALWMSARESALRRDRLPVVIVSSPDLSGRLLVMHEADLPAGSLAELGQILDE